MTRQAPGAILCKGCCKPPSSRFRNRYLFELWMFTLDQIITDKVPEALVRLSGAGIRRDGRWLVSGVDLSVGPGEIVTLIGPNGSGKSTTVKMALGLLPLSAGKAERRNELKVGYVPQKVTVDWTIPLKVGRFMELTTKMSRKTKFEALERTGVSHLYEADVTSLSGGEFQRVLLARAIAAKPDLLVLDEPVQGVDQAGEIALYQLISSLRDDLGCGVLLISHDLHVVMAATDRVICLNGHMCCSGTPVSVASNPEYQSLFGPRHHEALAIYQHEHDHQHLPDGSVLHADGTISDDCHHPHHHGANHGGKADA
jgi:zinc transport system ATP-binding protein